MDFKFPHRFSNGLYVVVSGKTSTDASPSRICFDDQTNMRVVRRTLRGEFHGTGGIIITRDPGAPSVFQKHDGRHTIGDVCVFWRGVQPQELDDANIIFPDRGEVLWHPGTDDQEEEPTCATFNLGGYGVVGILSKTEDEGEPPFPALGGVVMHHIGNLRSLVPV